MNSPVKVFNGVYRSPLDNCGYLGQQLRLKFLQYILAGTPWIVSFQKLRKPWLDILMHCLSFLGSEDFYTPIIVILAWAVDARQATLFTILMGIGFYLATSLKNIIRLPRPPTPPVAVLETTYDWSFPSLHAIIGVVLPGYICVYSLEHYYLSTLETLCLITVIISWSLCVNVSRMYLGVHSPADLICGSAIGICLLYTYTRIDDSIYHWFNHGSYVSLWSVLFYIVILTLHPSSDPPTHSYGETVVTNGVAFGMIFAHRQIIRQDVDDFKALMQQDPLRTNGWNLFAMAIARIVIGFPFILLTRLICKRIVRSAVFEFCRLLSIEAYSYSIYRQATTQLSKHYNSGFRIPAQQDANQKNKEDIKDATNGTSNGNSNGRAYNLRSDVMNNHDSMNRSPNHGNNKSALKYQSTGSMYTKQPLDVDTPTKFVTYSMMSCFAALYMHYLFHWMGLDM